MAMRIRWYGAKHIIQYGRSSVTLDATERRDWAIIRPVSPRRLPGSSVLAHTTKVVAVKTAPPKLAAKRHKTDPLFMSSMPQAS